MNENTANMATEAVEAATDVITNRCNGGLWFVGGLFLGAAALGAIQLTIKVVGSRNKKAETDFDGDYDGDEVTVNPSNENE